MNDMKQSWLLFNNKRETLHSTTSFDDLKIKCVFILNEGIEDDFEIRYFENNILKETNIIGDYFSL